MTPIRHPDEPAANAGRDLALKYEPKALRTFTPTQAVIARSAGVFHWTPDGRRLFDFTSGVLVANLGHNPIGWTRRFFDYMGWKQPMTDWARDPAPEQTGVHHVNVPFGYFPAVPLTAYNAVTPIEAAACERLVATLKRCPGGNRMEAVMWAASGSEAIQKALWAAMARDKTRPMILATRNGFHGKKGLAHAVTGSETDAERDPRVRFISFPTRECRDVSHRDDTFAPAQYRAELDALWNQFGSKIGTLITEPYLGGGGSYHPHSAYLKVLERFCREKDIVFVLDEVQANFGRCGTMFAFEAYGIEPDIVVLGKGLGNGVPVAAAVGRADIFAALDYGDGSDTWSGNPLNAASVLATLDEFESRDILGEMKRPSEIIEDGLVEMKRNQQVVAVRGEKGGMVWGVEFATPDAANALVLAAYRGNGPDGVHLLGPLAKKVVRIAPPLTITADEATAAVALLHAAVGSI